MQCDVAIFGGGAAGLWLLDTLHERGHSVVLLEAGDLGSGQTIASQGILHGGLKYTLQGLLTTSAANIAEMPGIWRASLQGRSGPNLSATRVRSEHCYLWRTDTLASRMGMIGAKFGLRVSPQSLRPADRPDVLRLCPGDVARLGEQVIAPASFVQTLAERHGSRILKIDAENGLQFGVNSKGRSITLSQNNPQGCHKSIMLTPRWIVLTAGAGNSFLRTRLGLSSSAMQRRPLHMVMVRGSLPELNGHCVDGAKTRVTITSDIDRTGRVVWQVGGQIAEEGVGQDPQTLARNTSRELQSAIPGLSLRDTEFATYRVDRAEAVTSGGKRPDSFQILRDGNVLTAWPTKLVLAPALATSIAETIGSPHSSDSPVAEGAWQGWLKPNVASPPWETANDWISVPQESRRAA